MLHSAVPVTWSEAYDPEFADGKPEQTKPGKRRRLTPKQAAFVAAYADKDSPTYSNGAKSYRAAYGDNLSLDVARKTAPRLLSTPGISSEIGDILRRQGADLTDRIKQLHSIAFHSVERRVTKQTVRDGEGNVKSVLETESEPTYAERTQAIHVLNKLSGDYEKPKVAADLMRSEYKALARKLRRELEIDRKASVADGDDGLGLREVGYQDAHGTLDDTEHDSGSSDAL